MTGYLSVQEHFEEKFSLMISVACLFEFVGIATLPLVLQYLIDLFGQQNAIIIFGAILWNLVAAGVAYKPVQRETKGIRVTTESVDRRTHYPKLNNPEENNINTQEKRVTIFVEKYFLSFLSLFLQENFMVFLIIECIMYFIFVSWALFLVSLGISKGFVPGTSGLLIDMRRHRWIPCLCLFGCALIRDLYILAALTFLSGLCQGVNSSGLFGLLPSIVCKYHLPQAAAISAVLEGIVVQLGGLISGMTSFL
ncbi:hypothetical protein HOLleu_12450 [Holothuria leucospilota]|uniref:Uncharacterized protein n=1 Tax=Holothuria leucospilota TaxID=206669 RepID=A0A9Q1CBB0_HOLLE|nr:hypothetical protein HOLleu_12450 [Holothuria leucospilota]